MGNEITEAVELCRAAADKLDSDRDSEVIFPGWDCATASAHDIENNEAIRRAARAIVGTDDPNSSAPVAMGDVASLVRYIADMLEE